MTGTYRGSAGVECRMHRAALVLLASLSCTGQVAPSFEVATLKLSPPPTSDSISINLGAFANGRFTMNNVTLSDMIKFAYEIVSDDQLVAPDWNGSVRFDIEALAAPDTPIADLRKRTQALLTERLGLRWRREGRVLPHLMLVLDSNGDSSGSRLAASRSAAVPGIQVRGRIDHPRMPMSGLVTLLSRFERQTIVDGTGLQGLYEVKLEWAPDLATAPTERPSLFTAVREQLGLRLESRRGPLEVLVVEEASREPAPN